MNSKSLYTFTESFGYKLLKAFIAVIVFLLFSYTPYSIYHEYNKYKSHFMNDGATITELLAHSLKVGVFAENRGLIRDISNDVLNHRDILSITVYNDKLSILSDVYKPSYKKAAVQSEKKTDSSVFLKLQTPQSLETTETPESFEFVRPVFIELLPAVEEAIYFEKEAPVPGQKIAGYVKVVYDKSRLHQEMLYIILRNILIALLFVLFSAVILYVAVKKVMKPLNQLTEGVKKFGKEEEYEKIPVSSDDEIGKLSSAFNEMAENLKAREEEKKLLEEHLAQAKKMEALGTLARGIAHDFNNILGIISGAMFIMLKNVNDGKALQKYSITIDNAVKRAKDLIQALFVFSRTDILNTVSFDINALLRETENKFFLNMNEHISYSATLSEKPLIIKADPLKIKQVITNIVSNAIDAMPEGGSINIKTENVHVSPEDRQTGHVKDPGDYACVSVTDTGSGMDEKTRKRLFEPFYTTKEAGKGTGLGLSIVYGIIEEHKGYLDVETEEGKGTTFRICLPLNNWR